MAVRRGHRQQAKRRAGRKAQSNAAERADLRRRFLARHGYAEASLTALKADASFRRYFRVRHNGAQRILMDAPPAQEDVRAFVRIARHLHRLGLHPPRVYARDAEAGFLLLEDFGDTTYSQLLDDGVDATELYAMAVDTLIQLHNSSSAAGVGVPQYNAARLIEEALLLVEWLYPVLRGQPAPETVRDAYVGAWRRTLAGLPAFAPTLVLRDYHVDNLMRVTDAGQPVCGLLDFQDAVIGSPAYDLVSLLEDARRDLAPELVAMMLARYFAGRPEVDRVRFRRCYAVLGTQRHCKVAGIFLRLCVRDGKCGYLMHLPRVLRLLAVGLAHPNLEPVRHWLDRHLPEHTGPLPPIDREAALRLATATHRRPWTAN